MGITQKLVKTTFLSLILLLYCGISSAGDCTSINCKLLEAAQRGNATVVVDLLREGANIHTSNEYGWTALVLATQGGHEKIVELLLKNEADPNVSGSVLGATALMWASLKGSGSWNFYWRQRPTCMLLMGKVVLL